jgi:ribosome modulation factor
MARKPRTQPDSADTQSPPNGPSPERIAEVLAEFTQLTTAGQRINQQKSTLLTTFQKQGGKPKLLKALHASLKLDKAEAVAEIGEYVRYHATQDIRVSWLANGQGALDDVLGDEHAAPAKNTKGQRDLAAARAHSDGYNSGLRGAKPSDNPFAHAPGSEEYVQWHDGRDEGQRDYLNKNGGLADRIAAAATADASMPAAPADIAPPLG